MAPHPIPLPCDLTFPPPSHRDATTPSPCWAPHFMTQERIMLSNPTPSKPHLSPAATMSDDTSSALAPSLHCASILQPATPPQVVAFRGACVSRAPLADASRLALAGWGRPAWSLCVNLLSTIFNTPSCFSSRECLLKG